jgi:hypothetical protein
MSGQSILLSSAEGKDDQDRTNDYAPGQLEID